MRSQFHHNLHEKHTRVRAICLYTTQTGQSRQNDEANKEYVYLICDIHRSMQANPWYTEVGVTGKYGTRYATMILSYVRARIRKSGIWVNVNGDG